jgi:hypothetical protein
VGHPKDRRPDLKQIQAGLAVSGDGGIPVFHRAYGGGAAEVAQVAGAMTALKQIAGRRPFLLVGDSKLISYTNAAAMSTQRAGFVALLGAARVPSGLFAALPPGTGTAVDCTAGRDAGKPAAARGIYRVLEDGGMDLAGPRKTDPPVHLRRCAPPGPGFTPPRTPSPPASGQSPQSAAPGLACAAITCDAATKASTSSNAATATSKAPSRWLPCS